MNQQDILGALAQLAEDHLDSVGLRVDDYGLPPECVEPIRAEVAVALAGCRTVLQRWSPRPALMSEAEQEAFLTTLQEEVSGEVRSVYARWADQRDRASSRVQMLLMAWNRRRPELQDRPAPGVLAAMRGSTGDFDHFERVDLGGGKYQLRYRLKPMRES